MIGQRGGAVTVDDKTTIPFTVIGQDGKTSANQAANIGTRLEILNKDQPAGMGGNLEEIWLDVKIDHNIMEGRVRGGAPVVSSRSVKTEIRLKPGFSAAIVGLTSSDVGTDFNKDDPRVATHGASTPASLLDGSQQILSQEAFSICGIYYAGADC